MATGACAVIRDPQRAAAVRGGTGRPCRGRGLDLLKRDPDEGVQSASLAAPMSGKIVRVFVKPGDVVKKGDRLLVLEAMKMEHAMTAGFDAVVSALPPGRASRWPKARCWRCWKRQAEAGDQA
jgi:biotin carboxyl carrier protein